MGGRYLLCRNDAERARVLDMSERLRDAERIVLVGLSVAMCIAVPTFGVAPLVPLAAAGAAFWAAQARLGRARRPERVLVGCWVFAQLMIACSIMLASGPSLYLLSLFIFPMLLGSAVYPPRAAVMCVVFTTLLMCVTAHFANPAMLAAMPFALVYPAAAMIGSAIPAAAVRGLDIKTRESAVVDQLTGTLNRVALEARVAELTHQASVTTGHVAIVLGDVDHFKLINDEHGHAAGDAVLREVALRLQTELGASSPVYRLGGEEFVVVLAGADMREATRTAERLRRAVADGPAHGVNITISLGVAASSSEGGFDYERTFAAADAALYRAKRAGRNRVGTASPEETEATEAVEPAAPSAPVGNVTELRRDRRRSPAALETPASAPTAAQKAAERWRERIAEEHHETGSWLVQDDVEREHLLELNRRIHASNRPAYLIVFGAVIAAAFTYGWITLIAPFAAAIVYNVVEGRLDRLRRPEFALGAVWLFTQAANGIGIAVVRFSMPDPPLFATIFMTVMLVGSSAIFPRRGVVIGIAFNMVVTFLAGLFINPSLVLHNPGIIAVQVAVVAACGLVGSAAGRSAIDHRGAAVVDRLTGLLTRGALAARTAELAHHATTTGQQVAVIVGDLDHFKSINDEHGHATGDAVLQEAAYRLRKRLRAFETAYRVGGEEFVILLPGVGLEDAEGVAQRTWEAVRAEPIAGVPVTMSFGLAATQPGEAFDYEHTFARADAALYEAKRDGRDRVCCAGVEAHEALAA